MPCECTPTGRDHLCVACLSGCSCPCAPCLKARKQLPLLERLAKAKKPQ